MELSSENDIDSTTTSTTTSTSTPDTKQTQIKTLRQLAAEKFDYKMIKAQPRYNLVPSSNVAEKLESLDIDKGGNKGFTHPWRTCILYSLAFHFVYIAFEAIQNLQSSLTAEDGEGTLSLAIIYTMLVVGSAFTVTIVRLIGAKKMVLISFSCHLSYVLSNFYPTAAIILPVSAILGLGMSGLSTVIGLYMSACSEGYMYINGLPENSRHGILSWFNGAFYSMFKATHLTGNLISSMILFTSSYNHSNLETNLCGAAVCASVKTNETVIEPPEQRAVHLLLATFAGCVLIGIFIIAVFVPALKKENPPNQSALQNLTSCGSQLIKLRFLILVPLFMGESMVIIIMYTGYTENFISCAIGIQWVGYSMTFLGVSGAISSLLVNSIARYVGGPALFITFGLIDLMSLTVMMIWQPTNETGFWVMFILPAVAGFSEGVMQPQFSALIADKFKDNMMPSYAAFSSAKCSAMALSLLLSNYSCFWQRLLVAIVLYTLGLVGYIVTEIVDLRERWRRKEDETEIPLVEQ